MLRQEYLRACNAILPFFHEAPAHIDRSGGGGIEPTCGLEEALICTSWSMPRVSGTSASCLAVRGVACLVASRPRDLDGHSSVNEDKYQIEWRGKPKGWNPDGKVPVEYDSPPFASNLLSSDDRRVVQPAMKLDMIFDDVPMGFAARLVVSQRRKKHKSEKTAVEK
jgi:hypothetical protein